MSGRGRPLRFLALIGGGWIGVRVTMVWMATGSLPSAIDSVSPFALAQVPPAQPLAPAPAARPAPPRTAGAPGVMKRRAPAAPMVRGIAPTTRRAPDPIAVQFALLGLVQYGEPEVIAPRAGARWIAGAVAAAAVQDTPFAVAPPAARWSGSGWLVARAGQGIGAAAGAGQLGGSQAGVRIVYDLAPSARVALAGRVTTPLRGRGAEAAVGAEWQPDARVPVRLVVEQRIALDPAVRGGPGVGAIAGVEATVAPATRIEAYGQAGVIARARGEPYADGATRLARAALGSGRVRLALGAGAWGAVQRDAARLDIGPSAVVGVPIGTRTMRVAIDWRQRVAGDARPGSGLALTLGADF